MGQRIPNPIHQQGDGAIAPVQHMEGNAETDPYPPNTVKAPLWDPVQEALDFQMRTVFTDWTSI